MNPGMMGDASFTSSIRLTDDDRKVEHARRHRHEINRCNTPAGDSASPAVIRPPTANRFRSSRPSPIRAIFSSTLAAP